MKKTCSNCGCNNRMQASFCKQCGTRLAQVQTPVSIDLMPEIIGHEPIKAVVEKIVGMHRSHMARGIRRARNNDMLLLGNSGTGKSLIVKSMARVLAENGILKQSDPIVVNAMTSFGGFLDGASDNIDSLCGAMLCIDSFQGLAHHAGNGALPELERIFELKALVEEKGETLMIVIAGIDNGDISAYFNANANIAANFRHRLELPDYGVEELAQLTAYHLKASYGMDLSPEATHKLRRVFKQMLIDKNALLEQNGKYVHKLVDQIFDKSQLRDAQATTILPDDIDGKEYHKKTYAEAVAQLDKFVGIDEIRKEIKSLGDSIQAATDDGETYEIKSHYLFLGNPGTGKTTIARVMSNVLTALEVLPLGHIVEVDRSQMVGQYVGETAKLVQKLVQKAMGGILFIDEAYALVKDQNDSFGREAVDTLLKLMEDHRGKFVVIAAGYTNEMRRFIDSNPGLKSRFNKTVNFRDYTPQELTEIFHNQCAAGRYRVADDYTPHVLTLFKGIYNRRSKDFANARTVRNVFEQAVERHNSRMESLRAHGVDTSSCKRILTREDVEGDSDTALTAEQALARLDELIGMNQVKEAVHKLKDALAIERTRIERGLLDPKNSVQHIVITGNPGTGKTTVGKLLGSIFHAIGLLPTDKVVEKEAKDLKSPYVNSTAQLMNDAVDEAMGGILFIDEAYMLMNIDAGGQGDTSGREAIGALITRMLNDAGKFVLVMAGYPKEMNAFVDKANPGFRRRFRAFLHIDDYTPDELYQIFMLKAGKQKFALTADAQRLLQIKIGQMVSTKSENFGNAGEIDRLFAAVLERQSVRLSGLPYEELTDAALLTIEDVDIPIERPKEVDAATVLGKLDGFVGLASVKRELRNMANAINVNRKLAQVQGRPFETHLDHYVFMGNPGTGKTTVAQMMADILFSLGLLPTNSLVSVAREDLVAAYVGQTAPKVKQVVQSALGGVLFIDEAYSLVQGPGDSFGMEALNTLLPLLLTYKDKFVCIVAGYTSNMTDFLHNNPGLSSRFTRTITFEDYTPEELTEIFKNKVAQQQLRLSDAAQDAALMHFGNLYAMRDRHFGNARAAGNFFERVKTAHSNRIAAMDFDNPDFDVNLLIEITDEDINNAQYD